MKNKFKYTDVTPEAYFLNRRKIIKSSIYVNLLSPFIFNNSIHASKNIKFNKSSYQLDASDKKLTDYQDATSYNNFYEFGLDKEDPKEKSSMFKTEPWTIEVLGEVDKPKIFDIEKLLKLAAIEERIYRLRCVEAWSMVIPWLGYPLSNLLKQCSPNSRAKFVQFETVYRPEQMPGQNIPTLNWPYKEAVTINEAFHPLSLLCLGMYGKILPNQNGAPVRVIFPWKYGFKSAKSIVKIILSEKKPITSWSEAAPNEYGFYANVNPLVDHPRWSQKKERRIGELRKRKTLMFNGYSEEVESLYSNLDLKINF